MMIVVHANIVSCAICGPCRHAAAWEDDEYDCCGEEEEDGRLSSFPNLIAQFVESPLLSLLLLLLLSLLLLSLWSSFSLDCNT